jgi:phosphoglycolate phosphatase-like HAD superfamily hydrolase
LILKNLDKGIFVDASKMNRIRKADGIIFDCDGVLINVINSYDLAIKKTVDFIIDEMNSLKETNLVTTKMIDGFKATGGFNDEVDVTYVLILSAVAARKLGKSFPEFINEVIQKSNQTGIKSVEKFLDSLTVDLSDIRNKLAYPGKRFENPLCSVFDEMFYGAELYTKLYNRKPKFFDGKGLIENDIVLVDKNILNELHKKFKNNIAIVTGRGFLSASHSLKKLFEEFNINNSRFLEDEPREMAKPNPQPIISSIKGMSSSCTIFVGDSTEDYIMAREAEKKGIDVIFCGVYGTSKDPTSKMALFQEKGVDIMVESVSLIPKTLNLVGV